MRRVDTAVPAGNRWHFFLFTFLGVGHLILTNFLYSTGPVVSRDVFPDMDWNFVFPRYKGIFLLLGFVFAVLLNHRISFFLSIFGGFLAMALCCIWTLGAILLWPGSAIGFWNGIAAVSVNSFFAATTRSKILGVALEASPTCAWFETQGLGLAGLFSVVSNYTLIAVTAESVSGTRLAVLTCMVAAAAWQFACGLSYKFVEKLAEEEARWQWRRRDAEIPNASSASEPLIPAWQQPDARKEEQRTISAIVWSAKYDLVNCSLVLGATHTVFPGVVFSWAAPSGWTYAIYGLYLHLLFQVFDVIGRYLSKQSIRRKALMPFLVARFGLIPFFCLCQRKPKHPVFGSLSFQSLLMILMALSNGYGSGAAVRRSAHTARTSAEKSRVGASVGLAFVLGLIAGTWMAELTKIGM